MSHRRGWILIGLGILMLMAGVLLAGPGRAQTGSRTFPETGKTVRDRFLDYWDTHGGLAQQGYPISEELREQSDTNGQTYTVQYFERAAFELHPENAPPFDVLLTLLGVFEYQRRYGLAGAPGQHASTDNPRFFAETQHTLGGKFRAYWEAHGGLPQQGFPISDEFTEVSDLNGQSYTVQYFQRAVFELHPENAGTPYEVLLSQLGTFRYRQKYLGGAPSATPGAAGPTATPPPGATATASAHPPTATSTPTPTTLSADCDGRSCYPPPDFHPPGGQTPTPPPRVSDGAGDITGQVLVSGTPVGGIVVILYKSFDGTTDDGDEITARRTDKNGVYHIQGQDATGDGEGYYVGYRRFFNDYRSNTLQHWYTPIFSYAAGATHTVARFDIGDVTFTGACSGQNRPLPTTLTWLKRSRGEHYAVGVFPYDPTSAWGPDDGNLVFETDDLKAVDHYTLPSGHSMPAGRYAVELFPIDPHGGRGETTRPCVFNVP